jgi:catechol-2,3-dioxygenase
MLGNFETKNSNEREKRMIGVRKISHASYETPDLEKQTEYYTDILGLTLIAKSATRSISPIRTTITP